MDILIVLLVLITFVMLGYSTILCFGFVREKSFFTKISIGYGLGLGFAAIELFLYSGIGIKWSILSMYLPFIIFIIPSMYFRKREIIEDLRFGLKLTLIEKLFAGLSILLLFYTAFESVLRPLSAWDGFAIWLAKSKMFFIDGFVNPSVYFILKDSYPYIINLAGTFIYEVLGRVDDTSVLLMFYGFYLSLFLIFISALKEKIGLKKSIIFSFLLISTQNIIRHGGRFEAGYADLALGYYIFVSYYLLQNYIKDGKLKNLIILQIILAITALIKVEGLVFCLIINTIFLFYFLRQRKINEIFFSFLWVIPLIDWQIFKTQHGINFTLYENPQLNLYRIPSIIYEMGREFINIQNWNLLWVVFFVTLIMVFLKKQLWTLLFLLIVAQIAVYFSVFIISPNDPSVHVRGVFNRLLLHIAPLVVYFIAVSFVNPLKRNEK